MEDGGASNGDGRRDEHEEEACLCGPCERLTGGIEETRSRVFPAPQGAGDTPDRLIERHQERRQY